MKKPQNKEAARGRGRIERTPFVVREDGLGWMEQPVPTVGKLRTLSPKEALDWNGAMLKLSPLCGQWFPRGVFKFKSWEEEREWTRDQIKRALERLK
jgi:hypothetical protein